MNITERDNSTQNIALWGMLLMQFLFLGLVAWRLTAPTGPTEEEKKTAADEQAEVKQLLEDINKTRASTVNREAQMYVLDQLVERIEGGDANLATSLQSSRAEAVRLRASLDSQIALTKSLELETEDQKLQISNLRIEKGNISKNLREVRGELADANNSNKELQTKIKDMENGDAYRPFYQDWKALTACALIAIVAAVGGTVLGYTLKREEEEDEEYTPRSNAFSAPKMSDVEPEVEPDDTTFQITDSDEGESPETDHQDENPKEQE